MPCRNRIYGRSFFARHYDNSVIARRLFDSAGPRQRHAVVSPLVEDVSNWSTEARMQRYLPEALPLATKAVEAALTSASIDAADVGMFAVASCTGYATPGLDALVASQTRMSDAVQRLFIGHMGCYAALPALSSVADFVVARNRPAVVLCTELSSLHMQPRTNDVEQMVAHALFSDAASAVVVEPSTTSRNDGLCVVDVEVRTDVAGADLMTWNITDLGFRMGLSNTVPDALQKHVRPVVDELLARRHLSVDDVAGWAVHPGGPRILDIVGETLKLQPDRLQESRTVLAEHGNCSSATVLVVLDQVRQTRELQSGQHVVSLAFGSGLTLYAMLLRAQEKAS